MGRGSAARAERRQSPAEARRDVADAIAANARALNRIADPELAALLPVLREAEAHAGQGLAAFLARNDGAQTYTIHHHQAVLYQLRRALHDIDHTAGAILSDLTVEGSRAQALALANLRRIVETGALQFEGAVRPLPIRQAAIIAEGERTLMVRYESSARRYAGQIGMDIRRRLAVGLVRAETIDQMTTRLLGGGIVRARARGVVGEAIAGRMFEMAKSSADRLVRTEVVNAYNLTHQDAIEELEAADPGYVKKWDAANDARVCPYCRDLDDTTSDINGSFEGGIRHPPAHPNCRCTIVPWRVEWGVVSKLPATAEQVSEGSLHLVPSGEFKRRGFNQLGGVGYDKVKLAKARAAIAEGQKNPITISIGSRGQIDIGDGRHRLAAAIEANAPIKVRVYRGI